MALSFTLERERETTMTINMLPFKEWAESRRKPEGLTIPEGQSWHDCYYRYLFERSLLKQAITAYRHLDTSHTAIDIDMNASYVEGLKGRYIFVGLRNLTNDEVALYEYDTEKDIVN